MKKLLLIPLCIIMLVGCHPKLPDKIKSTQKSYQAWHQCNELSEELNELIVLLSHKNKDIRYSAVERLEGLSDKCTNSELPIALNTKDERNLKYIVITIGGFKDKSAILALTKLLDVRNMTETVISALGEIGDEDAGPELMGYIENIYYKDDVIKAIGKIKYKDAIPDLLNMLKNVKEEKYIRKMIINVFGDLEDKIVVPVLLDMLESDEYTYVFEIVDTLGDLRDSAAVPQLVKLIRTSKHDWLRYELAISLGKIGDKSAAPCLIEALQDDNCTFAGVATEALGKIGDKAAVPVLVELIRKIEDGKKRWRGIWNSMLAWEVVSSLSKIKGKESDKALVEILGFKKYGVSNIAARELAKRGNILSVPVLISVINEEGRQYYGKKNKELCIKALQEVTGQDFGSDPAKWSKWWEQNKDTIMNKKSLKNKVNNGQ